MGLPEHVKIIVVGHQPEFFHPGVLAKFIAGDLVAQKLKGVLVHLVVDHLTGSCNTIEIPERQDEHFPRRRSVAETASPGHLHVHAGNRRNRR